MPNLHTSYLRYLYKLCWGSEIYSLSAVPAVISGTYYLSIYIPTYGITLHWCLLGLDTRYIRI